MTYPSLNNTIKETLVVGYSPDDRTTCQKVKFHNKENEYWGTFHGTMTVEDTNIDGGTLENVSINNATLSNVTLIKDGMIVTLDKYGELVQTYKNAADEEFKHIKETELPNLDNKIIAVNDKYQLCVQTLVKDDAIINARIDAADAIVKKDLTAFVKDISAALEEHINSTKDTLGTAYSAADERLLEISKTICAWAGDISSYSNSISSHVDLSANMLDALVHTLSTSISTDVNTLCTSLSITIDNTINSISDLISTDFSANDEYLSNAITAEIKEREDLSVTHKSFIDDLRWHLAGEVGDRVKGQNILDTNLNLEAIQRSADDQFISASLTEFKEESDVAHRTLSIDLLKSIEHDKHYTYFAGPTTTDKYPYECHDFAVNVYKIPLKNASVQYTNGTKTYDIATLIKSGKDDSTTYDIKVFKGLECSEVYQALSQNGPTYTFTNTKKTLAGVKDNLQPHYTLTFNDGHATALNQCTIDATPDVVVYHTLSYMGTLIGRVTEVVQSGVGPFEEKDNIESGQLMIDSGDTSFEIFAQLFNGQTFDQHDRRVLESSDKTTRIEYKGNNEFIFKKNIDRSKYFGIYTDNTSDSMCFGRVYETLNGTYGIVYNDVDKTSVKEINVQLFEDSTLNPIAVKLQQDTFSTIVRKGVKADDGSIADYILSADINDNKAVFEYNKVSKKYKYSFNGLNLNGTDDVVGTIIPKLYNKTLAESRDFDEVEVDVSKLLSWINVPDEIDLKRLVLRKRLFENIWFKELNLNDDAENSLIVKFNGNSLFVVVASKEDKVIISQKYDITNLDKPVIANEEDWCTPIYHSKLVDLNDYTESNEYAAATYSVSVSRKQSEVPYQSFSFTIKDDETDVIKIQLPTATSPDISREFLVVLKPISPLGPDGNRIPRTMNVQLVDQNDEIQLFNRKDNKVYIDSDIWTVLSFKELKPRTFHVEDLNDYDDINELAKLNSALQDEIQNRIEAVETLSADLSSEIQSLSSALSVEIQTLSGNLSCEIQDLSTALSGDINSLSDRLSVEIQDLSSALSGNIDSLSDRLSTEIQDLSASLSGDINSLSDRLSVEIQDLSTSLSIDLSALSNDLQLQINSNDFVIAEISGKADFLLQVGHKSVEYWGSLIDYNPILDDSDTTPRSDYTVSAFFNNTLHKDDFFLKQGFVFKLSSDQTLSIRVDDVDYTKTYCVDDYLIINKDVILSNLTFDDIDVIRNSEKELADLKAELTNLIDSNYSEFEDLSSDVYQLSSEVSNVVSVALDDLSAHYHSNISADIELTHEYSTDPATPNQRSIKVDQLVLVDEVTFKRYRLTVRNGALNISLIDSIPAPERVTAP